MRFAIGFSPSRSVSSHASRRCTASRPWIAVVSVIEIRAGIGGGPDGVTSGAAYGSIGFFFSGFSGFACFGSGGGGASAGASFGGPGVGSTGTFSAVGCSSAYGSAGLPLSPGPGFFFAGALGSAYGSAGFGGAFFGCANAAEDRRR